MKVYTKTGDKGTTCLIGGTRISKADHRIETYGTSDELNSFIGLLRAAVSNEEVDGQLKRVQNKLFNLGAYLALDREKCEPGPATSVSMAEVKWLEDCIDEMEQALPVLHSFVLPGGSEAISRCHVCRTVCRRLERHMVSLFDLLDDNSEEAKTALQYVNRLSDYLFILSKKIAQDEKNELFLWEN
ncbi:MAG: cob(I)yrinic acid a,c-diamide adenosyltransferase [Bacteroidales bacterium]|nr:cob(I)yrinic acid a,c-diamide adenosyltransferase [Candidatus Colicola faecequi]